MSQVYFLRLNEISEFNLLFEDFLGNTLLAWNEASKNNKDNSFKANCNEVITIIPVENSIYDKAGNVVSNTQTYGGAKRLNSLISNISIDLSISF